MEIIVSGTNSECVLCDTRVNIVKHNGSPDIKHNFYSWNGDPIRTKHAEYTAIKTKIFEMSRDGVFMPKHETSAYQPMEIIVDDIHFIHISLDNSWFAECISDPLFTRFLNIIKIIKKIYNSIHARKGNANNICVILTGTNKNSWYRVEEDPIFKIDWCVFNRLLASFGFHIIESSVNNSGLSIITRNPKININIRRPKELNTHIPAMVVSTRNTNLLFWFLSENVMINAPRFNKSMISIFNYMRFVDYAIGDLMNFGAYKQIIDRHLKTFNLKYVIEKNRINYINLYSYANVFKHLYVNKLTPVDIKHVIPDYVTCGNVGMSLIKQKKYSSKFIFTSPTSKETKNKKIDKRFMKKSKSTSFV